MIGRPDGRPTVLVVGGCTGLVGRAVLAEFSRDHRLRSLHRSATAREAGPSLEPVAADAATISDWTPYLTGVDTVVNLAWYRQARRPRFVHLADGLIRLVRDAERVGVRRFVHVSVPDAPASLEHDLPYLTEKRRVDRAVAESALAWSIVRPTMLFGPRDKLLTVMLRTIRRYRRFPMFGSGDYHLSPLAVADLAAIVRLEAAEGGRRIVAAGGPTRWRYRELTDELFRALGHRPRYVHLSDRGSVRLARALELLGSSRIYAYEVTWLLSDLLGLPPYPRLGRPLEDVRPFLVREAGLTGRPASSPAPRG